jgi:hypothetical protein
VIGVVVYGLYGASSYQWGFSSKGTRQQVGITCKHEDLFSPLVLHLKLL